MSGGAELAAEARVLGAVLLPGGEAWPEVADVLVAEDFRRADHREVWESLVALHGAGATVDVVTTAEELQRRGATMGLGYLGELARNVPSAANVRAYAEVVRGASRRRQAAAVAARLAADVEGEGMAAVDAAVRDLLALSQNRAAEDVGLEEALRQACEEIDAEGLSGVTTGLADLDETLGGLHSGDLVVVAGRPAMGKTALMCNLALASKVPCGIVSSEQPAHQIAARLLALEGNLSVHRMRTRRMRDEDWPRLTFGVQALHDTPVRILDRSQPSIAEVERQARAWHYRHGMRVLFVDYVQRLRGTGRERRHEDIGEVMRGLKHIARELDVPVVALAQVNRGVESRTNKRPGLADLKDSGDIEQEADQILLLYRDEVYDPESDRAGQAEIIIGKNRHGPTGCVMATWDGECMAFRNHAAPRDRWSPAA